MDKADLESIEGLSPSISIQQKSTSHNPRSTVGTITEVHDYLRLLFARVGVPKCPEHHIELEAKPVVTMVAETVNKEMGEKISVFFTNYHGWKRRTYRIIEPAYGRGIFKS